MEQRTADTAPIAPSDLGGLEPMRGTDSSWPKWIGIIVSVLMAGGLARELFDGGLAGFSAQLPRNPVFYLCFAVSYMASPLGDFVIYRRLWGLPVSGLGALLRKRIANDVAIGYSGDLYFYAWARQRMRMVTSPFGNVKDVTILSGVTGNIVTLTMLAIVLPYGADLIPDRDFRNIALSAVVMFMLSVPFVLFSRRVFALPYPALWAISGVHLLRIVIDSIFLSLAWHLAMPDVPLIEWAFLVAGRLLVFRLPLVPNKDLLFANFAIIFIGQREALSDLVAFGATLTLLVHIGLAIVFALSAVTRKVE
ncbi:hypothetical protein ACNI3Q_07440 [Sphingomonas sp. FW199]|uniref:hypothetical protein n=1 Tax=Sphingomonas sp. FW199 TaxID=3400217 RepID=UPI003CE83999